MKKLLYLTCVLTIAALAGCEKGKEPVDYVDTSTGNISHLLVPCKQLIHLPNSMMRAQPEKFDGAAMAIDGLPFYTHAHRFATPVRLNVFNDGAKRKTWFIDCEKATPYSYSVFLCDDKIQADFAVGRRAALYSFDFSESEKARRVFAVDAMQGLGKPQANGKKLEFSFLIGAVRAYVAAEFTQPIAEVRTVSPKRAEFVFGRDAKKIGMKYAVSFIGFEKARKSLKEIRGFEFKPLIANARKAWNKELSRVKINKGCENQKQVFYSAFYRALERPANFDEHGEYFNFYKNAAEKSLDGKYFYTDDWSWDTYRTSHPMRVLLMPKTEFYILESILRYAEANPKQWIPKFMSIDREYKHMNGNHIYASFLDAHVKGIENLSLEKLLKYALITVETKTLLAGSDKEAGELSAFYKEYGFIPAIRSPDDENSNEVPSKIERRQSVSVTTALAYDDWCIGRIAEIVGDKENAKKFLARGDNYKKLFEPTAKFFLPKDADGKFIMLTPAELRGEGAKLRGELDNALRNMYYTENNAYVYRFDAEHAIGELVKMFGGQKEFEKAIDEGFATPLGMWKYLFLSRLPDHTGILGSYSVANEPAFRVPYLYNVAGAPWKTQKVLRHIIDKFFRNDIMGIPGDEDGGAMTAFVVMTHLGFYPMNVGTPYYEFGTPFFEDFEISLENGNRLRVMAMGASSENKYVKSIKIDGKPHNKTWIAHKDLVNAKLIEFEMSNKPAVGQKLEPSPY